MSFDPEKVDRFRSIGTLMVNTKIPGHIGGCGVDYIPAFAYDQLLEMWRDVQPELRMARGLKALLANGMPPTGNAAFDEILATHPIAAMIQRGWLGAVTGFDDLPSLEWEICHFYGVNTIEEALNPPFPHRGIKQQKPTA